eukprot:746486-Heterocapsa_arctica.AAC.1
MAIPEIAGTSASDNPMRTATWGFLMRKPATRVDRPTVMSCDRVADSASATVPKPARRRGSADEGSPTSTRTASRSANVERSTVLVPRGVDGDLGSSHGSMICRMHMHRFAWPKVRLHSIGQALRRGPG